MKVQSHSTNHAASDLIKTYATEEAPIELASLSLGLKPGHIKIHAEFDHRDLMKKILNDTELSKAEKLKIICQNKKQTFRDLLIALQINPKELPDSVSNLNVRDNITGTFSHFEIDCTPAMMERIGELPMITSVRDITSIAIRLNEGKFKDAA